MSAAVPGNLIHTSLCQEILLKTAMSARSVGVSNTAAIAMVPGLLQLKVRDCFVPVSVDLLLFMILRKSWISIYLCCLCLLMFATVFICSAAAREIRVFKLQYASPSSVARICETLFTGQGTFVASPQINALVVNADDKELFHEIEKLLAALDRRPATLRYTVRSIGEARENRQQVKFKSGRFPGISNEKNTSNRQSERSVLALEFARARFTDDQIKVFSSPGWYGNEVAVVSTSHGLSVSGHLTESGRVIVQVWYAEDSGGDTENLLTELEVEAGQWAEFGGLVQGDGQRQRSAAIGTDGGLTATRGQRQTDRRFAIRVDLIR